MEEQRGRGVGFLTMAIGNGEDEGMPIAPRARHREVLDDNTDVTGVSDRELLLRAVNSTLVTEQQNGKVLERLGMLHRRFEGIDLRLGSVDGRLERIEQRLQPNGEIEHRARAVSSNTLDGALAGVAQRIVEAVNDERDGGRGNVSTARVLEMIQEHDAMKEKERSDDRRKFKRDLTVALIAALVGVAGAGFVGHFEGRATAPQTQTK